MPRVKRGVTARAKHKKVFEFTKGHRGRRKNVYRVATQSMDKALQYAYRDRRNKKRDFRENLFFYFYGRDKHIEVLYPCFALLHDKHFYDAHDGLL